MIRFIAADTPLPNCTNPITTPRITFKTASPNDIEASAPLTNAATMKRIARGIATARLIKN